MEEKLKEEAFAEEERRVEGGRERDGEIEREKGKSKIKCTAFQCVVQFICWIVVSY